MDTYDTDKLYEKLRIAKFRLNQLLNIISFLSPFKNINSYLKIYNKKYYRSVIIYAITRNSKSGLDSNMIGFMRFLEVNKIPYVVISRPGSISKSNAINKRFSLIDYEATEIINIIFARKFLTSILYCKFNLSQIVEDSWREVFSKIKNKLIVTYLPTNELCEASKKDNILIVEPQHGVVWKSYGGYNKRSNYSLPDLYISWTKKSSSLIKSIVSDLEVINYQPFSMQFHNKQFKFNQRNESKSKTILLTLSDYLPPENQKIVKEFQFPDIYHQLIENSTNYKIKLRVHPWCNKKMKNDIYIYTRKMYEKFGNTYLSSNESIIDDLIESDIHLSIVSSASIEAAYLGIYTIYLCHSDWWIKTGYLADNLSKKYWEFHETSKYSLTKLTKRIEDIILSDKKISFKNDKLDEFNSSNQEIIAERLKNIING